ncbi:hypothetical protein BDW60DRAFT_192293 [Aspergillus nidulans var. acristatus]
MAGENLLYIPPEHRQYTCFTVNGATIALRYGDGRVLIGFHVNQVDFISPSHIRQRVH